MMLTSGHPDEGSVVPVHVHAVTQRTAGLGVGAEEHVDGAFRAAQVHLQTLHQTNIITSLQYSHSRYIISL